MSVQTPATPVRQSFSRILAIFSNAANHGIRNADAGRMKQQLSPKQPTYFGSCAIFAVFVSLTALVVWAVANLPHGTF